MRQYAPLTPAPLPSGTRLAEPDAPTRVDLDDAAFAVMTDLRTVRAATITPGESMARAHAQMIERGVRLLFVLDPQGALAGVITATDLLGEKPMRFMQARGLRHAEVTVADLMTPSERLEALALQDVSQMRVGHIVATHRALRRQHIMVADEAGRVRGLFSASQAARQLGVELNTTEVAQTFADIEAALVR